MSRQSADNFMRVAERFSGDAKLPTIGTLAPTVLYALAAPSTPDEVISERKRWYEVKHPETKNGATAERAILRQLGEVQAPRFTADTAAKLGTSERKVQRAAARGHKINDGLLAAP